MTQLDDARTSAASFDLADRYRAGAGPVLLTGVQAIARHARRAARRRPPRRAEHGDVRLRLPGQPARRARPDPRPRRRAAGERRADAGARRSTRSWPRPRSGAARWRCPTTSASVDGVVGVWYGKGPGVDRAGDPMRHGNMCGAHPHGGVLVLAGDDPSCKSSTIPCISERTLAGYGLPVLFPGNAEEIVRLGRYGVALSRASGMWVGHEDRRRRRRRACSPSARTSPTCSTRCPRAASGRARRGGTGSTRCSRRRTRSQAEAQMYGPRWAMVRRVPGRQPDQHRRGGPAGRVARHRRGRQGLHRRPAGAAPTSASPTPTCAGPGSGCCGSA